MNLDNSVCISDFRSILLGLPYGDW